ncbi:MAG TPA: hypothetical protein VF993_06470, partial [Myxococcales bacterium]
ATFARDEDADKERCRAEKPARFSHAYVCDASAYLRKRRGGLTAEELVVQRDSIRSAAADLCEKLAKPAGCARRADLSDSRSAWCCP